MPLSAEEYDTFCELCANVGIQCSPALFNLYLNLVDDCKISNCSYDPKMNEGLDQKGLAELTKLCDEIGIETIGDLQRLMDTEALANETPLETLKRYRKDILGPDFKMKENLGEDKLEEAKGEPSVAEIIKRNLAAF